MVTLECYLKNPCGTLSIPYWKAKAIHVPDGMKIVHDREFLTTDLNVYRDERYFRLYRDLQNPDDVELKGFAIETATENDLTTIVSVINQSYTDLHVTCAQMKGCTETPVYDKHLWVLVREEQTRVCVGCGIADFDREAKELILEWIQVLPAYRGRKIGQAIVNTILHRAKDRAAFATVSGKADALSQPERLYRACGFVGHDIWHVMQKKRL